MLEEPLGGSAESNVLRGRHVERNLSLAIKLLPRRLVDRPMGGDAFGEDVKRLQGLVHPHIARVMGGATDNGQPYLALELIKGESLRSLYDRRGRLPWETMVDLAEQICEGLQFAHEKEIVHGRLTPTRVLLDGEQQVKLIGFDCQLGDRDEVVALKSPMAVMHYLAPQEIRGKRSVGLPSNDLFSLGVILYEGLTGALPWPATTPAALITARNSAPAPRVSAKVLECPVWLDVLVARLLEVKRENRFTSVDEARRAIVVAKSKVAAGVGTIKEAMSGRRGALAPNVDKKDLNRLRQAARAAAAPKDTSAFYERAWFLALCLVAVIGFGVWALWPLSEAQLYERAKPLMASELVTDWRRAQDDYLSELLERFPDTQHKAEIEEFQFRYAIHEAEERIKNIDRFGGKPLFDADRDYHAARRNEQMGDRLSAWEKYDAIVKLYADSEKMEERAVAELARKRIVEIRADARNDHDSDQLRTRVQEQLDRAATLVEKKQLLPAREVLESIVELYDGNQEVAPLVEEARQQIRELREQPQASGER